MVLYDMLGVPELTYPIQIEAGNQTFSISTGDLPAGFYNMVLETPGQGSTLLLKKLIKQE